ncbi:MAG: CRISPR-associated endonuclease Cas1 [Deltaproteobacteria bacterium]|jgi:CRISPR-associated protein Cas1|nr:CRISPR-associated endonuclease Cas1 [Deltaproteobacteria bacterium]
MVVYIRTQGVRIVKEGQHLLAKKGGNTYHTLFTYKLKQLLLFGNIEVTHGALCQLMRKNIDTVYLTKTGRYLGRINPPESKNVFLHKKQFLLLDDKRFGLQMAKSIISGKLSNMATFLKRIKRSRKHHDAGNKAKQILSLLHKLENTTSIDKVRGYEGRGSAIYFQGLKQGFIDNIGFKKRIRRPPTDPVNAVLSLLYTFLLNKVYAGVRTAGLNPYPGFLHTIDYGRYSLVLDLMEEFRSIIVDTLTISLFNLKILKSDDFQINPPQGKSAEKPYIPDVSKDPIGMITMQNSDMECFDIPEQRMEANPFKDLASGRYPVRLKSAAFKRVIDAFEKKLTTSFYYPPADTTFSYNDAIFYQAKHYRKIIEGEIEQYQPILLK